MKTSVDIPKALLDDVKREASVRTNREAITLALEEYLRVRRSAALVEMLGTLGQFMDRDELARQRGEG